MSINNNHTRKGLIMTEQDTGKSQNAVPIFRMQKMYIKDLSFENPNSPDVFLGKGSTPKVDVNLNLKNRKLESGDNWEVVLSITAKTTNSETGDTLFIVEIEHAGVFLLQNIPEEHMAAVLAVECPTLMFPFTRQIICQASIDGGFIPFLMEPVNFLALYQNAQKKKDVAKEQ